MPQFQMNLSTHIECLFVKERYVCLNACVRERERESRLDREMGFERGSREKEDRERKRGERVIVEFKIRL